MLPVTTWASQQPDQPYVHPSLASEGFIHCTGDAALLLWVANRFYRHEAGEFLILCIDETRVTVPVQWDRVGDELFPHLYGPLNLDAIVALAPFARDESGQFLPPQL